MRALLLSHRAVADLREIWVYSFRSWGEAQADRYLDELEVGLCTCRDEPELGRTRDEVRPGYRSQLVRKHVLFYTYTATEVRVQRVLHASMDPTLHLPNDTDSV